MIGPEPTGQQIADIDRALRGDRLDEAMSGARALLADADQLSSVDRLEAMHLLAFGQCRKGPVSARLLDGALQVGTGLLGEPGLSEAALLRVLRRQSALQEMRGWYLRASGDSRTAAAAFGNAHATSQRLFERLGLGDGDQIRLPTEAVTRFGNLGVYADCFLKMRALGLLPAWQAVLPTDAAGTGNPALVHLLASQHDCIQLSERNDPDLPELPFTVPMATDGQGLTVMEAASRVDRLWRQAGNGPVLSLPQAELAHGWALLREAAGMGPDDWFAALHMREPTRFYRCNGWTDGEDPHRRQSVSPTLAATPPVTDAGGWVIRMGDPSVAPLPPAPRLFDYAHSPIRSPGMDLFLCAAARFLWGTASGPIAVAWLFGTPTVASNWIPLSYPPPPGNALFIPKLLRWRDMGRVLTLAEMLEDPARHAIHATVYADHGLDALENDPEDIAGLLSDRVEAETDGAGETDLQANARRAFEAAGLVLNGRIGNRFLTRHRHLLFPGPSRQD